MMNLSTKIIFVFAFAVFNTSSALSCSCADPSVRNKFRSANSVFIGHVVDMSPFNSDDFPLGTSLVKFKVEKQWKGPRRPAIPGIADVDEPGMCSDLNLTVGKRYLIYASSEKGRLRIYADCGPNRAAEHAEDEVSNSKGSGFDFTLASILIQKFKVYQLIAQPKHRIQPTRPRQKQRWAADAWSLGRPNGSVVRPFELGSL